MADESIYSLRRPGFPKESNDGSANRTLIEYVGLEAGLRSACPTLGMTWGEYAGIASDVAIDPLDGTDYAILSVTCELKLDQTAELTGSKQETSYEVDWVTISRPLKEHPEFQSGVFTLSVIDLVQVELWQDSSYDRKKVYKYETLPGDLASPSFDLSDNAKKYAAAIIQGIETFDDHAPVVRISETWVNGPPDISTAGLKDDPPSFPNLPSGYEWIKTTDRSLRAGGQFRWERSQEWVGAQKILVDAQNLYYATP